MGEELFSHLLVTERKRSERSSRPFVLLLLRTKGTLDPASSRIGAAVVEALAAATRGTDIVGWLEWSRVLGVIFSELGGSDPVSACRAIDDRVRRELRQRLGQAVDEVALDLRVYPESGNGDSNGDGGAIDPVFHSDLRRDEEGRRVSDGVKRVVDAGGALALLVMLAPLLLVVAALVRLTSPGPVLFRQLRLGRMGQPFTMLKFRTMYVEADQGPHYEFISRFIKESAAGGRPEGGHLFKLTNDPRITPVGRLFRKTSIDELPQLWNVVRGEMSLVGPRPPLPYEFEQYAPWHRRRVIEAKPGVTGLWQVMGRSRTSFDEMVRLDLQYARSRSLWADLRILLRTPAAVLSGKGAC